MVPSLLYSHCTYKPEEEDVSVVTGWSVPYVYCSSSSYLRPGHIALTTSSGFAAGGEVGREQLVRMFSVLLLNKVCSLKPFARNQLFVS